MIKKEFIIGFILTTGLVATAFADTAPLPEVFSGGKIGGSLKSFYYAETFETDTREDSHIWANGGNVEFVSGRVYGLQAGGEFQLSFIGAKDDPSGVTIGSMDAEGIVMSEAYLQYAFKKSSLKGGRQHINLPLIANSGSRMIKESFEGYFLTSTDLPATIVSLGWVRKYQTRTDQTRYADNSFVDFEENGDGDPGDFYDIGEDGIISLHVKNESLKNVILQAHYTDVLDEVAGLYTDAGYTFAKAPAKPYIIGQYFYTHYEDSAEDDNSLLGLRTGVHIAGVDFFAGYTSAGGSAGDARVYRGLGQAAYSHFTDTTKTSGVVAYEAGTEAYQVGVGYSYETSLITKLRFSTFDNPIDNADLDEYTVNIAYSFSGLLEKWNLAVDFSVLDYENDERDATDLRTRLVYTF